MNKIYNVISIVKKKKKKLKNRYDIVYSNDKNQNEKLLSLSLSSYLFSKPSNFPVSFRLEQSPRFLRYKKLPTYVHTVVARVQNHSFRLYWTRPRSPIIRKRLERTLQNVIASFSSFLISPLLFPHNRLVNTLFQQHSHKTKWTSNPKRRKTFTTVRGFFMTVLPNRSRFLHKSRFSLFHSYFLDAIIPLCLSNESLRSCHIRKFQNFQTNTISDIFVSSYIEWSISSFSLLEKK